MKLLFENPIEYTANYDENKIECKNYILVYFDEKNNNENISFCELHKMYIIIDIRNMNDYIIYRLIQLNSIYLYKLDIEPKGIKKNQLINQININKLNNDEYLIDPSLYSKILLKKTEIINLYHSIIKNND